MTTSILGHALPLDAAELAELASSAIPTTPDGLMHGTIGAMRYLGRCELSPLVSACCAIGVFDGLHRGHRTLIQTTIEDARRRGVKAIAVTFDPDPADVLPFADPSLKLLASKDRVRGLLDLGVDAVLVCPFTQQLADTTFASFIDEWLLKAIHPLSIHVGRDFRMGVGGAGTVDALRQYCSDKDIEVFGHELVSFAGKPVTATRIRKLLMDGDVAAAAELLGRLHFVEGHVQHGRGEGTSFGFPTANVTIPSGMCMPKEGVYACLLACDGRAWPAAANVGMPPTFARKDNPSFLEANLLGFSGDLYGRDVRVLFVAWLRESRRFDSLLELENVVRSNIDWVARNLGGSSVEVRS